MKQTLFMVAATLVGTVGNVFMGPFAGVAVYYLFAVLRPQYLWQWALPDGVSWSQYVAVASLLGVVGLAMGFLPISGAERREAPGMAAVHRCYLVFGAWICLTCLTARNPDVSWPWLIEYLKIFLMFAVATFVMRDTGQVWWLYLVATCALVYVAWEVNAVYLFQGRLDIYHRGYGGLDNNGAGLMLAIGVPLALYAWEGSGRWWRWGFVAAIPVLLHAVLMTYSRGAMLSLVVTTPLTILRSRRRVQFMGLGLVMACLIPILAGPEIRARFFSVKQYEADASAASRFGSWKAAYRMANDYPVVGVGVRNSNLYSQDYGADMEGRTIHSQYLQILADSGYPGLALYLLALSTAALTLQLARRRLHQKVASDAPRVRSMINGLEGSLLVFAFGSSFLSLEVFELPYLVVLLIGQVAVLVKRMPDAPSTDAVGPTRNVGEASASPARSSQ